MKIPFKLSRRQLIIWIGFMSVTWGDYEVMSTMDIGRRMRFCLLSKLMHDLQLKAVIIKERYNFKVDAAAALAFVEHAQATDTVDISAVDLITINFRTKTK